MKIDDIDIGDKVRVREWGGKVITGYVEEVEEDIKNGRPGIEYVTEDGEGAWCYLDQIVKVIKQ